MNEYEPRTHLPDDWAKKAVCPVCQSHGLIVNHTDGPADRMVCPTCQVSFEIAQGFTHIRLTRLPNRSIGHRIDLIGTWIDPAELKGIIERGGPAVQGHEPAPSVLSPSGSEPELKGDSKSILSALPRLTQEDTTQRALNLKALGNSPDAIKNVLNRAGATPDQITIALVELDQLGQKKVKQQTTLFWIITGAVGVLVLVFAIWFAVGGSIPGLNANVGPTTTPVYLSIPDFSGNATPTSAFAADTQTYFRVLWNLQGDYLERAAKLKTVTAPDELKDVHQKLIDDYTYAGLTKNAAEACLVKVSTCIAPSPDPKQASSCKNVTKTCQTLADQAQTAYNQLSAFITGDGCQAWQTYYSQMHEAWPMAAANGGCRAP